jgi:hypothetical protein
MIVIVLRHSVTARGAGSGLQMIARRIRLDAGFVPDGAPRNDERVAL